jgi:hypothetical protein
VADLFALSPEDAVLFRALIDRERKREQGRKFPDEEMIMGAVETSVYLAYTPAGGIPARIGLLPGSADCVLYYLNDDDELTARLNWDDTDYEETVYNLSRSSVAGSSYIQCKRETLSNKLFVDWEDC